MKKSMMARIGKAWLLPVFFFLATAATLKAETSGDYTYEVNGDGSVKITEYTGLGGAVAIPDILDGRTVVGIGRYAFSASATLTGVTIPASVIYIEEYAFSECTSLSDVSIGKGVTSIGFRVFNYCTNLTTITVAALSSSYSDLAGVLFNKSQTTLVQCPAGKAGAYTIPAGVTSIGEEAFMNCAKLTSVTIGNSVASVGDMAFWGCTSLAGVTIPDSVTSIGDDAFSYCTSLTGVTLPGGLAGIGASAFYECTGLTSITIPGSVTNIGDRAFLRCTGLMAITVDALNASYSSSDGVLFNKGQTTLVQCPGGKAGSYTVPNSVTNIGGDAFAPWPANGLGGFGWCTSLTSVTIPNSVTSIGKNAFLYCSSLTSITIPNSVTSIGYYAFENCSSLTSVTIPNSVANIAYWTFASCSSLTSITIPNSVTNIESQAFTGCNRLLSITVGNGVTSIGDGAFSSCTNLAGAYFRGNAPSVTSNEFANAANAIIYYINGTTGWGATFGGRPTALWNNALPEPTIKANGAVGTVTVNYPAVVSVTVAMDAGSYAGVPVDWWVVVNAGSSWYYKDSVVGWTQEGAWRPVYQGGLFNLPATEVLNIAGLGTGSYTFYFAVDYPMDGILNVDGPIFVDSVNVIIQ